MPWRSSNWATSWAWMPLEREADDAGLLLRRRAQEAHAADRCQHLVGRRAEQLLVGVDRVQADRVQIVDRRAQADGRHDRRRAGFELGRQIGRLEAFERHAADHAAAAQKRRHRVEQLAAAVEHADARWARASCAR